ncbi:hypothetical protein BDY21DRAFT_330820 [Lineolata rhizophorae]|uniref:Uncharacterized protein n=1 Tax=Lineolata rhizophorae TaxID=578093 RepID=A0A6A6PES3_9PEZI|nr:hypothetical protein BDY21DRAFT_330820 [Lineolata rhizophorae]
MVLTDRLSASPIRAEAGLASMNGGSKTDRKWSTSGTTSNASSSSAVPAREAGATISRALSLSSDGLHNIEKKATNLPVTIIFGSADCPDEHHLPSKLTDKLPLDTLRKLIASGEEVPLATVRIVSFSKEFNAQWRRALLRLKEYLETKDYRPFKPAEKLQVIDNSGSVVSWPTSSKQEDLRATASTHEHFLNELNLYAFSCTYGYGELRRLSGSRLRSKYPVFVGEALELVEHAYTHASDTKDDELSDFIFTKSKQYQEDIAKTDQFLTLLRRSVEKDRVGSLLLESLLSPRSQKTHTDLVLSRSPPAKRKEPKPADADEYISGQLSQLCHAVNSERLLVAVTDGYGTLVGEHNKFERNRDFKFCKSELLVADYSRAAQNGRNNITVQNSRGEKGDILAKLVRPVPPGLGAADYPVNTGIRFPLDREERTYPALRERSRSRSPGLQY